MRGQRAANWKGGRHTTAAGYVKIYRPDHALADSYGYVSEHRLMMEEVLGRMLLRGETVHHINGIKHDNRPENLQLRSGNHGTGIAHRCMDCGSTHVEAIPLT